MEVTTAVATAMAATLAENGINLNLAPVVDLLTVGNNLERNQDALSRGIAAIRELLDKGRIHADSIAGSLARIATLKQKIKERFHGTAADPQCSHRLYTLDFWFFRRT